MKWIVSRCPICGGEVVKSDDFPDDFGYMWKRVECSKGHKAIIKRTRGVSTDAKEDRSDGNTGSN